MKKHWIILSIVAAIMAGAISLSFVLSRPQGDTLYAAISVAADSLTEQGMAAADTTFTLRSKYRITQEEVREMLEIEPDMGELKLVGGSGRRTTSWKITPGRPLADNTIYTIRVKNPLRGAVVQSFAFQTRSDLSVRSVYPADGAGYVPVDAGIEIGFSMAGVDMSRHFEILPPVSGTFETRDYTAVFQPDAPLERDNIYRVTVKAGLSAPDGTALAEDYSFSFETTDANADKEDYRKLRLDGEFAETFLTGDPMGVVMTSGKDLSGQVFRLSLHRFPNISAYIDEVKGYDVYYKTRYGSRSGYRVETGGLEEVASYEGELIQSDSHWTTLAAPLPAELPEGHYVATVTGTDADGEPQFVQKLIQVRNLSVYSHSVDGETLLWLNDPATGGPLNGQAAVLEDANGLSPVLRGATRADGTADFATRGIEQAYLTIEQDGQPVYFDLLELAPAQELRLQERFYTGLYCDRPLYQSTDTASVWGQVYPRVSGEPLPAFVWLTLRTDWPEQNLYRERVPVGADGTFSGSLRFSGLASDWYTIAVTDGGDGVYTSQSISVENYTKPSYTIEVSTERAHYFANEPVPVTVRATYLDGTPVSGGTMQIGSNELQFPNSGHITLGADGSATITGSWIPRTEMSGWEPQTVWVDVWSTGAQDLHVSAGTRVTLLPSAVAARIDASTAGELTIQTARIDTTRLAAANRPADSFAWLRGAAYDLPVVVHITRTEYVRVPDGSYYDYANNETVTRYRVEAQSTVVENIRTRTVNGKVTVSDLPYENTADTFYTYEAQFAGGIAGDVVAYHTGFQLRQAALDQSSYAFFAEGSSGRFDANQPLELGIYENGRQTGNTGRVLYSVLQKSTLLTGVFDTATHPLTLDSRYLPNVVLVGAYFDGRHIYPMRTAYLSYNYDAQRLRVGISTDKESFAPGDTVRVRLTLSDAAGNPVAGSAAVGVVDESVFLLRDQQVDLAAQIYASAYYPYIAQQTSYVEYPEGWVGNSDLNAPGGMGGGPDGASAAVRETFLDTAAFQTVDVDESGSATVEFQLPDNVTRWRITAAAVTADLMAGDAKTTTIAALPFYLRPVLTGSYLVGDDVSLSAGVGGSALAGLEGDVSYAVTVLDSDGFQVDGMTQTAAPGERALFNLGKYEEGTYTLTLSANADGHFDAWRREFQVLRSASTVPRIETMPLNRLQSLTSARYPVGVTVYDERLAPMLEGLQWLSGQDGERTEIIAAAWLARASYSRLLEEDEPGPRRDVRLDRIQEVWSGVRPLSNAGPDAALTARMLLAAPSLVDQTSAKVYLEETLKNPSASPNDRVMSYLGLAALDEPILLDLTRLSQDESLTAAQKLWLGAGMARLGDYAGAQALYQGLSRQVETEGKLKYLLPGGSLDEQTEATSAALALTTLAGHPDADAFMRYFLERDDDRARSQESLPHLEMLLYTNHTSAAYTKDQSVFRCVLEGGERTFELGAKGYQCLLLSREALAAAQFETVAGDLYAAVSYTGYAEEASAASASKVAIEKSYTTASGGSPRVGEQVRVDLRITFTDDAPAGCYNITDYIPSGMRFMPSSDRYAEAVPLGGQGSQIQVVVENDGQQVRGFLYRGEPVPLADRQDDGPDAAFSPTTEPVDDSQDAGSNTVTLSYYVSASLPGEFVSESAYITPHAEGVSAKTQRSEIIIE